MTSITPPPEEKRGHIVLPLYDIVLFPQTLTRISIGRDIGDILVEMIQNNDKSSLIGLTIKENANPTEITPDSFYRIGNLLEISIIHPADDGYLIGVSPTGRVRVETLYTDTGLWYATGSPVHDEEELDENTRQELISEVKETIHAVSANFQGSEAITGEIDRMESIDEIIGFTMPFIPVSLETKQALLESLSPRERGVTFLEILTEFRDNVSLRIEMARKVSEKVSKSNREAMLREQLRVIQEELNGMTSAGQGEDGYRNRIEKSDMPEEVRKKALAEVKKLESGGGQNHESPVIRNYLDLLLDLPWTTGEKQKIDIAETRRVLDSNHYGLGKVKERIIQHLAVMKLKNEKQGSILLFAGPPGTGKTSLGKSIADALGRKYVRVSLGGIRDEAEIRGHRRTYVGALPGRIIQGIKRAGTKNPVFVLDEIDKLAYSNAGDPASALLEVLDPEQNNSFSDHYLEVPYDLSDVLFIATANSLASIPGTLLDRMELIEISGYTKREMAAIGKNHLLPRTIEDHGLSGDTLILEDAALFRIIDTYTREAGVRGLKKQLDRIARFVSEKIVSGQKDLPYVITADTLVDILGKEPFRHEIARTTRVPGIATGLAWTPVGGEILFIEGTFMPGTGKLLLTGQLGDVMKESANISMSLIRSRFAHIPTGIDFLASDVHIHVPSGATPKDGPSAGITLLTALVSLITGKTVDPKVAMTGEITLSGSVLPVGGIKEKILAAHRAGITRVLLPEENAPDLEDVPEDVRNELTIVLVRTIDDVLHNALDIDLPRPVAFCTGDGQIPAQMI